MRYRVGKWTAYAVINGAMFFWYNEPTTGYPMDDGDVLWLFFGAGVGTYQLGYRGAAFEVVR